MRRYSKDKPSGTKMAAHDNPAGNAGPQNALEAPLDDVISIGSDLFTQAQVFSDSMFRPWSLYQLVIAVGVFIVAHLLRAILGPRIREWMGSRDNWPKWRMRILVVVHQRLRAIFFVALI